MIHFLKANLWVALCALCLVSTPGLALSETAQKQTKELMVIVAMNEATERYEEALEAVLTAIEVTHFENDSIPLRLSQKTIDLLWINGKDLEAVALCDSIIDSLVSPKNEQKIDLGLAVWKRSLIAISREEGFSKKQKIQSAKALNISALNHFVPYCKKKAFSVEGPMILLASYTQEEIQKEHDTAFEKEVQSWIDVKDFVKEFLDENKGSAIEKAGESVIHHWESMYHGVKAIGMELKNQFEDKDSKVNGGQDSDLCDMRENADVSSGDGLCDMRD